VGGVPRERACLQGSRCTGIGRTGIGWSRMEKANFNCSASPS
jgi:hypothetical protein